VIALRPGSASAVKAESAGFRVMAADEAAAWADVVMVLVPDELQADLYREQLAPNLRKALRSLSPTVSTSTSGWSSRAPTWTCL
jgi:ketol-acid reductoisomerase